MKFYFSLLSLLVLASNFAFAQDYKVTAYVDVEITSKLPGFDDLDRQRFEDDFELVVETSNWPFFLGTSKSGKMTPPIMWSKKVSIPTQTPNIVIGLTEEDQFFDDNFTIAQLSLPANMSEKMIMVYVPTFGKGPYEDAFERNSPRTLVAFRKKGSSTFSMTDSGINNSSSVEAESFESDDFFPKLNESEIVLSKFKRLSTSHKPKNFVAYLIRIERL